MHVVGLEITQGGFTDARVKLDMYLSVSEMHEWKKIKDLDTLIQMFEKALTQAMAPITHPVRPKGKRSIIIERE
jgi:hypothetical protein